MAYTISALWWKKLYYHKVLSGFPVPLDKREKFLIELDQLRLQSWSKVTSRYHKSKSVVMKRENEQWTFATYIVNI